MQFNSVDDAVKPLDEMVMGRGIVPPKNGDNLLDWIRFIEKNYGAEFVGFQDNDGVMHSLAELEMAEQGKTTLESLGMAPKNLNARVKDLVKNAQEIDRGRLSEGKEKAVQLGTGDAGAPA